MKINCKQVAEIKKIRFMLQICSNCHRGVQSGVPSSDRHGDKCMQRHASSRHHGRGWIYALAHTPLS